MYLWKTTYITRERSSSGNYRRSKYILTSRSRAEDADYRGRQTANDTDEVLECIELIGYIPGIAETGPMIKPKIYYIVASYLMPEDPEDSTTSRRVPTEFGGKIDQKVKTALEIEDAVGPIPLGPEEAMDIGMLGIVLALAEGTIQEAKDVIASHVFSGEIPSTDINIVRMCMIPGVELVAVT